MPKPFQKKQEKSVNTNQNLKKNERLIKKKKKGDQ
jgi:hypothetical protein